MTDKRDSHTPGPWAVVEDSDIYGADMHLVGSVYSTATRSDQEAEANARLIAAAPAMLEALRWITRCAYKQDRIGIRWYAISEERMAAARSALALATSSDQERSDGEDGVSAATGQGVAS